VHTGLVRHRRRKQLTQASRPYHLCPWVSWRPMGCVTESRLQLSPALLSLGHNWGAWDWCDTVGATPGPSITSVPLVSVGQP